MDKNKPIRTQGSIYIISDGTGETAATMIRAALVHFSDREINIVRNKNIRTNEQIESLVDEVFHHQGLVVHTIVSPSLRQKIKELTSIKSIPTIDLLGPIMQVLQGYFGEHEKNLFTPQAGALRTTDEKYFKRIEAIEYTVRHDDGKIIQDLDQADIVLVGISRTSKTPLSIFLSHKGWKVANIPLVYNLPLPESLYKIDQRKIVGLTIDNDNLVRIRRKRLEKFGQDPKGEYASVQHIQKELEYAQNIFKSNRRWPVFNVTDRALEETAAEIIRIVASRMDIDYEQML